MKKLLLSTILCLLCAVHVLGYTWTDANGTTWTFGTTTYNGVSGAYISDVRNCPWEVVVPEKVYYGSTEYVVKWVGRPDENSTSDAPFYNKTITKVTLPSSVIGVENSAFSGCSSLSSIDLSSCTSVGEWAFFGCSSLSSIDLSSCTSVGSSAFYRCSSLSSIDLSSCTSVGDGAFYDCEKLHEIDLPSVKTLSNNAFSGSYIYKVNMSTATPPAIGTNSLGKYACVCVPSSLFDSYKNAEGWGEYSYRITTGTSCTVVFVTAKSTASALQTSIGEDDLDKVFSLKINGSINGYDIFVMRNKMPNLHFLDLTDADIVASSDNYRYYGDYYTKKDELGDYAFYEQTKLFEVKLPKSIKKIGSYAFYGCSKLLNIEMYECLQSIGEHAFYNCDGITEIILPKGLQSIGSSAFYDCDDLRKITFPEGLQSIGSYAFYYCDGISEIILPKGLQSIGSYAFCDCYGLKNVVINDGPKIIAGSTFYSCGGLKSIKLPETLTTIREDAFTYCSSLTDITLPASLTNIENAFGSCSSLMNVYATAIDPKSVPITDSTFPNDTYRNGFLHIPYSETNNWRATYDAYYWNTQWGQFYNLKKWEPTYTNISIGGDYNQDEGTIPGESIDADFGENSGYIIGEGASQDLDSVVIKHNGTAGGSIIVDGTLNINKLHCEIAVKANTWYFFCFPFDVKRSEINAPGSYVIRYYDGEIRATKGSGGWVKLGNDREYLKAGVGYIFQTNTTGTLKFIINHPDMKGEDKKAPIMAYATENMQNASWNLVGNPYLSYFNMDAMEYDSPITVRKGTVYEAVRPGDDDYHFAPYEAFFVQKPEGVEYVLFKKEGRETYTQSQTAPSAAKQRPSKIRVNPKRNIVNLTVSDGENTDKTRVVFNEEADYGYELSCDASKFFAESPTVQLYSIGEGVSYSINERPALDGEVELGFLAAEEGDYTIAASRMDCAASILDKETGATFDLSDGDYTFHSEAGTFTQRFVLVKSMQSAEETDISSVNSDVESGEDFALYDLTGRKVAGPAQRGVYIKNNKKVFVK
ncbi:MAG: leucine-rich repeat domain-containing protein [Bacteroidaceae bacterium]|nr:leucine-rich repeat domain-containing protein [Bacteroidaceae bacterium]